MAKTTNDVRALLAQRIGEIEQEAGQLSRALKHLDGGSGAKGSKKPRRRGKGKRRPQAQRGQRREQLLKAIKAKPGSTGAELARATGINPGQTYGLLHKAQAADLVVKSGTGYAIK
jgi:predicted Rossmann fold nucleotide-binding protein DprA/Smf involved in DNA uptake